MSTFLIEYNADVQQKDVSHKLKQTVGKTKILRKEQGLWREEKKYCNIEKKKK